MQIKRVPYKLLNRTRQIEVNGNLKVNSLQSLQEVAMEEREDIRIVRVIANNSFINSDI